MLKFLRFEIHVCLALSKYGWVDLQFFITVSKKNEIAIKTFSHGVEKIERWKTRWSNSVRDFAARGYLYFASQSRLLWELNYIFKSQCQNFEVWFKSLTHNVEKTERWITTLTRCVEDLLAKKNHNFVP